MKDYKQMYLTMVQALIEGQRSCEAIYIETEEETAPRQD